MLALPYQSDAPACRRDAVALTRSQHSCVAYVVLLLALHLLCSVPSFGKRGYIFLKEEKGFSDTAIISGVLLLPLTFGALFICVLDALYTRRSAFDMHDHQE